MTHLSGDQRLRALEWRAFVLSAWRSALEVPLAGASFTAPGTPPVRLALGDPWPAVDQSVRGGPARFDFVFSIPELLSGRDVELELDVGGEGDVRAFQGGREVISGGLNPYHRAFPLGRPAGGDTFEVTVEAVPKDLNGKPNPAPRLTRAHLVVPETELRALLLDLQAVLEAARELGEHDAVPHLLHLAERALGAVHWPTSTQEVLGRAPSSLGAGYAANIWQLPPFPPPEPLNEAARASLPGARQVLQEGLTALRATFPPHGRVALSGHAHLDLAWLWPLAETRRKGRRTFRTVLQLMREYPELHFNQSSAQLYAWIERDEPELFAQIAGRAREGRVEAVGGMWVEPDGQMPGGESWARQLLYGQRYFQDKFGRRSTVAWLPDTFGFSPALPQLFLQAGLTGFFTTKLNWNETTPFPHDLFWWEGLDGSRVLAHCFFNEGGSGPATGAYNGEIRPRDLLSVWRNFRGKNAGAWRGKAPVTLFTYGYGDGGGGPSREMMEHYGRLRDFPALPRLELTRVDDFFRALPREELPLWVGELYLELHRGTLTSQALVKKLNREAEHRLQEAEALASLAWLRGAPYPAAQLEGAWKTLLLNQFHDILPGSSIREVYEDARTDLSEVVNTATALRGAALGALGSGDTDPAWWTVANPSLQPRPLRLMLESPQAGAGGAALPDGTPLPWQVTERGLLLDAPGVTVPPLGLLSVRLLSAGNGEPETLVTAAQEEGRVVLENALLRAEVGPDGTLARVYDKAARREVLSGPGNRLVAYGDLPREWEAWDVAASLAADGEDLAPDGPPEIVEQGPLRAAVRVTRRYRSSRVTQTYRLGAHTARLDVDTEIDWHERRVLLRALFPLGVRSGRATFETAFGAQERPTHRNTPADAARFEVSAHRFCDLSETGYGVALLNDGKYGHEVLGQVMALSLVRGPTYPDPGADEGLHAFRYALWPHAGDWTAGGVAQAASDFNSPLFARPTSSPAQQAGLLSLEGLPLMLGALKKAEDEDRLILRAYEPHGARGEVTLHVPGLRSARRLNLLEEGGEVLDVGGGQVRVQVRPFEVLTLGLEMPRSGEFTGK